MGRHTAGTAPPPPDETQRQPALCSVPQRVPGANVGVLFFNSCAEHTALERVTFSGTLVGEGEGKYCLF